MINKNTGVSRQIGFVRFDKLESSVAAVKQLNGYQLEKDAPGLIGISSSIFFVFLFFVFLVLCVII